MHFLASQLVSSRTKVSKCFQVLWDRSVDGHVTGQSNSRRFTNLSLTILYLYIEHQDVLVQQNVDYTLTKKLWFIIHTLLTLRKRDFFWWRSHSFTSSHNKNIGFGTKPNRLLDSIFTSRASNFSYRNTLQKSCFHASSHISALHDDYYVVNNSLPQKNLNFSTILTSTLCWRFANNEKFHHHLRGKFFEIGPPTWATFSCLFGLKIPQINSMEAMQRKVLFCATTKDENGVLIFDW